MCSEVLIDFIISAVKQKALAYSKVFHNVTASSIHFDLMLGVFPIVIPVFHSHFVLLHSRIRLQNASTISIVRRIQRASMAYANAKTNLSRTKRPANQVKCR